MPDAVDAQGVSGRHRRAKRSHAPFGWALAGGLTAGACYTQVGGDEHDHLAHDTEHAHACAHESRAEQIGVGSVRASKQARFSATVADLSPAPPARYENAWTLDLRSAEGAPLVVDALTPVPWMPDHLHGSNGDALVRELGQGRYEVSGMNLHMSGLWELRFEVEAPEGPEGPWTDEVVFSICVP